MTADQRQPSRGRPVLDTAALASGSRDILPDTMPAIVWRTAQDDPDATAAVTAADHDGLPARLARWIIALYTRRGDTVADLDADASLHEAATATGRDYLHFTQADLASSSRQYRPVTLVAVRWPRHAATGSHDLHNLLAACHRLLAEGAVTVVVLTTAPVDARDTGASTHEQLLLMAAAASVGLRHLHDIIWMPATDGRDSFTYYATAHDTAGARDDNANDNDNNNLPQAHTLTLKIFVADVSATLTRHEPRQ